MSIVLNADDPEPPAGTVVEDTSGGLWFAEADPIRGPRAWRLIDAEDHWDRWADLDRPLRVVSVPATQEPKPGPRRRPADDDYNYDFEAGLSEGLVQARDYLGSLEEAEESDILSRLHGWLDGRIGENRP